jgi:carbamoyl-phosphate synthase large subunit
MLVETAKMLTDLGLTLLATRGTAAFLGEHGIASDTVNKAYEGGRTVVDIIKDGGVQLVLNTTEGAQAVEDSRSMRAVTLADKIPYYTTLAASHAAAQAMKAAREGELGVAGRGFSE